jgi:hypothetical protein
MPDNRLQSNMCSVEMRACETLVEVSEMAVLFLGAQEHANAAEDSTTMAEFGRGKKRLTWTTELHTKCTEMCQEVF